MHTLILDLYFAEGSHLHNVRTLIEKMKTVPRQGELVKLSDSSLSSASEKCYEVRSVLWTPTDGSCDAVLRLVETEYTY